MRDRPFLPHPGADVFSRRRVLRGAGALGAAGAAGGLLSGCGSAMGQGLTGGAPPASQVNFWNPFTGGDGASLAAMQDAYRRKYPDDTLKGTTFAWGDPYYTKLTLSSLGGRPPQVAVAHLSKVPSLASAGLLHEITPEELKAAGMSGGGFDAKPWQRSQVGGKVMAIPLDTHPFVLYYRTDVAEKAGLLGEDGQLTDVDGAESFLDALRAAKEATGGHGGAIASVKDPAMQFRLFWSLYRQLGGELTADGGTRIVLDDAAAEEALAFIQRMTKEKLLPSGVDGAGAITQLTSGKAGFLMDGVWQLLAVQGAKTPFDMKRFPRIFDDAPYACAADSHAFVLPKARTAEAQRADLSMRFVRTMLDESLTWVKGGHVPAWGRTQKSEEYRTLEPQSHYADAADGAAYQPDAWYMGSGSTGESRLGDVLTANFAGRATPRATVGRLRAALKEFTRLEPPVT